MTAARIAGLAGLVVLLSSASPAAEPLGGNPCDVLPWQTTDNGTGAEPGVIREFASLIVMPPGCLRGGKVWVPRIRLGLTRTGAGSPDMEIRVSLREPESTEGAVSPPSSERTPPTPYTIQNVPINPGTVTIDVDTAPNNNQNINLIHRDGPFYVSIDMDGDVTGSQFLVTDLQGPLNDDCFTDTTPTAPGDGAGSDTSSLEVPTSWEVCLNGIIDLNEAAQGATGYTFYGRYTFGFEGDSVNGREPLGTTWGARYLNGGAFNGGTKLTVWRDSTGGLTPGGQTTICEYENITEDFEFECTMNGAELALLAAGKIFVELSEGANVESIRMLPANLFIFADGFESGDTSVWTTTVQ